MKVLLITPEMDSMLSRFVTEKPSSEVAMLVYDMIALSRREGLMEAAGFATDVAELAESMARANANQMLKELMEVQAGNTRKVAAGIETIAAEHKKNGSMLAAICTRPR